MKKFIFSILMIVLFCTAEHAAAQQVKFYYYPSNNVYYNPDTKDYMYRSETDSSWVTVKTLPKTIILENTPRYAVYHSGLDVWNDNAEHIKKYKVKKNGEVKAKIKN